MSERKSIEKSEQNLNVTPVNAKEPDTIYLPIPTTSNPNMIQPMTPINLPYQMTIPSGIITPNSGYYNPFINHTMMVMSPNTGIINNQGIIIPQASGTDQFFYIPGNIVSHISEPQIMSNQQSQIPAPIQDPNAQISPGTDISKQMYFVPKYNEYDGMEQLKEESHVSMDESAENELYDTIIVPVQIKKEDNGHLEILPDTNKDFQPTNNEQMNILKKIKFIKQQNMPDSEINTLSEVEFKNTTHDHERNQPVMTPSLEKELSEPEKKIIGNMKDNTKGFMMVRVNKKQHKLNMLNNLQNESTLDQESDKSLTKTTGSLLPLSLRDVSKPMKKNKSRRNKHRLKLSAATTTDKSSQPKENTSRFRRLRLDDRTEVWSESKLTCVDQKMKNIPMEILNLANINSIVIPDNLDHFINDSSQIKWEEAKRCEHSGPETRSPTVRSPWRFLTNMCSMNNCEFDKLRMGIQQT